MHIQFLCIMIPFLGEKNMKMATTLTCKYKTNESFMINEKLFHNNHSDNNKTYSDFLFKPFEKDRRNSVLILYLVPFCQNLDGWDW